CTRPNSCSPIVDPTGVGWDSNTKKRKNSCRCFRKHFKALRGMPLIRRSFFSFVRRAVLCYLVKLSGYGVLIDFAAAKAPYVSLGIKPRVSPVLFLHLTRHMILVQLQLLL
ncbi:hypothetical protein GOP47_0004685, partial [Adiantum capillus-veneris]